MYKLRKSKLITTATKASISPIWWQQSYFMYANPVLLRRKR